jgi:methyl-accepting chemotaxis protein
MKNLKIGTKLLVGFGTLIIMACVLGAVSLLGLEDQNQSLLVFKEAARAEQLAQQVSNEMLEARRREKDFILRQDKKYIPLVSTHVKNVTENIDKLLASSVAKAARVHLTDLKTAVGEYERGFLEYIDITKTIGDKDSGVYGEFRGKAKAVEQRLSSAEDAQLMVFNLMARRHEKDYMLRKDHKYLSKTADNLKEFAAYVNQKDNIPNATKIELIRLMSEHEAGLKELANLYDKQAQAVANYREAAHRVDPIVEKLLVLADEKETESVQNAENIKESTLAWMLSVLSIVILASVIIAVYVSRQLTSGINKMVRVFKTLTKGDLSVTLDIDSKDEIGQLAENFNLLIDYLNDTAKVADKVAEGDLTINVSLRSERDRLNSSLQKMVTNLSSLITKVQEGAEQVSVASEEISSGAQATASGAQQIAQGAEKQSSTVQQTSASVQQMNSMVQQVFGNTQSQSSTMEVTTNVVENMTSALQEMAHKAGEVAKSAEQVADEARDGGESIRQSVEVMKQIGASSQQIGEIIGVITDISEQINLLALNAAIEAARAGEHGRGFAVVAEGVTKLADRSQEAAKEITEVIKSSSSIISEGTVISDKAGEAMSKIINSVDQVTNLIQSITDATVEQAKESDQVKKSIEKLNDMSNQISIATEQQAQNTNELVKSMNILSDISQQNASIAEESSTQAEESSSASEELVTQSQSLQQAIAVFKVE